MSQYIIFNDANIYIQRIYRKNNLFVLFYTLFKKEENDTFQHKKSITFLM